MNDDEGAGLVLLTCLFFAFGNTVVGAEMTLAKKKVPHWTEQGLVEEVVKKWQRVFASKQFLVCWSSGHVGTKSMSKAFASDASVFTVNELDPNGNSLPTLKKIHRELNATLLWEHIDQDFLPEVERRSQEKDFFLMFGHNSIFGILPALLHVLPIKVVRLRRDACQTIDSFLRNPAICPEYDIDERGYCVQPCPGDQGSKLSTPGLRDIWDKGPIFKNQYVSRVWWYLDEVEVQWRELVKHFEMDSLEVYWNDGDSFIETVQKVADFVGAKRPEMVPHSHNDAAVRSKDVKVATESSGNSTAVAELRESYLKALTGLPHISSVAAVTCNSSQYVAPPMAVTQKMNLKASSHSFEQVGTPEKEFVGVFVLAIVGVALLWQRRFLRFFRPKSAGRTTYRS